MTLSILIPVYNGEDYIENAIVSLCQQDIKPEEYEIIVIDDGSTDGTIDIIEKLAELYPNIKINSQKNRGVGNARNVGLNLSKGKYIYFLDADDYILNNTLAKIIDEAEKNDLQIIGFKSRTIKNTETDLSTIIENRESLELTTICDGKTYIGNYGYRPEIWWYIINREFLLTTNLTFYDRKFLQDSYYTPALFMKANRMAYLPLDVHRYRLSNNSVTRNTTKSHIRTHIDDMMFAIKALKNIIDDISIEPKHIACIEHLQYKLRNYVFIVMTRFIKSDFTKSEINSYLNTLETLNLYPIKSIKKTGVQRITYGALTTMFNSKFILSKASRLYSFIR